MGRIYGSIHNRFDENRMFCKTIEVGTPMTEYYWSDRHAYEVVEVTDQKHVKVREYDVKHKEGSLPMSNDWDYISNPENPVYDMERRGNYWYYVTTFTKDMLLSELQDKEKGWNFVCRLGQNGITVEDLVKRGTIKRFSRANVSFGVCDYYYDYEF